MRGGALPLLAWSLLLGVLLTINWIWTNDTIQVGLFAFAVLSIVTLALTLTAASRGRAIRRGPPEPATGPEAVTEASLGAVLLAIAIASIIFGLAFGRFLVYFGGGLLIISAGLVIREQRAARRSRLAWSERSENESP
jgi:hypothetical protein